MRRLLTLALLAAFVVILAGPASAYSSPSGGSATDARASGSLGTSRPADDGAVWRGVRATSVVTVASPWRVQELHALLATSPVFVEFAAVPMAADRPADLHRSHAPPHPLNAPLRI